MTQPAFSIVCDNCDRAATDWYAADDRWICASCWDPFGTFWPKVAGVWRVTLDEGTQ